METKEQLRKDLIDQIMWELCDCQLIPASRDLEDMYAEYESAVRIAVETIIAD